MTTQKRNTDLVNLLKPDFVTRDEFMSLSTPLTGTITMFGGSAAPTGYLLCDGTAVSRTTYAILFGVIGTAFGVGDGVTTFNLPDLRQRFPLGKAAAGTGSTLGGTGGAIDHVHTGPSHAHTIAHTHEIDPPNTTTTADSAQSPTNLIVIGNVAATPHTHDVDIPAFTSGAESTANSGNAGTGNTGSNNPPFQVVNFIIKT